MLAGPLLYSKGQDQGGRHVRGRQGQMTAERACHGRQADRSGRKSAYLSNEEQASGIDICTTDPAHRILNLPHLLINSIVIIGFSSSSRSLYLMTPIPS